MIERQDVFVQIQRMRDIWPQCFKVSTQELLWIKLKNMNVSPGHLSSATDMALEELKSAPTIKQYLEFIKRTKSQFNESYSHLEDTDKINCHDCEDLGLIELYRDHPKLRSTILFIACDCGAGLRESRMWQIPCYGDLERPELYVCLQKQESTKRWKPSNNTLQQSAINKWKKQISYSREIWKKAQFKNKKK